MQFNTSLLISIRSGQGIFAPFTRQTKNICSLDGSSSCWSWRRE